MSKYSIVMSWSEEDQAYIVSVWIGAYIKRGGLAAFLFALKEMPLFGL